MAVSGSSDSSVRSEYRERSGISKFYANMHTFILDVCTSHLIPLLDSILHQRSSLTIVDYGACDLYGHLYLKDLIIGHVRKKKGTYFPITWIFEDQATNDFNITFSDVNGLDAFREKYPEVYILASGTGFYHQCIPNGSVDLGLSFLATHWLSALPCHAKRNIFPLYSEDCQEKEAFQRQAFSDWQTFLGHRSSELAKDGILVMGILTSTPGGFPEDMALDKAFRSLVYAGEFNQEDLSNTTFPYYYLTERELMAPFESASSHVARAGLRVSSIHTFDNKGETNVYPHINDINQRTRAWTSNVLMAGMVGTESEKQRKLDMLFDRAKHEVLEAGRSTMPLGLHIYQKTG